MAAIVALNNANIMAAMINAPNSTLPPALPGGATAKSLQETMSRATKTLDNSKKSTDKRVENTAVIYFLSDLLRKKLYIHPADENNYDPVDDISDSLAGLILNKQIQEKINNTSPGSKDSTSDESNRLYSAQSNLIEENSHLRVLVLKKDNEVVSERSAEYESPLTNDMKERVSKYVSKEPQLSALNPLPFQIFSVGGAEAKPLLTTVPIIA
ncbi:20330_t:CDS:2, partial [Racocetra persica]